MRHSVNVVLWFLPPTRMFGFRTRLLRLAGIEIGDDTRLCGRSWVYGRGRLSIGANTWISPGAEFFTNPDAPIEIGSNCDIGPGCSFVTGSHDIAGPDRRAGAGWAAPIQVETGCWIGAKSLILGGTTIGSGSVVAAGAVVVQSVPGDCLAAGVPAKPKKDLPV
jgi:maltose O-acetyltransferase